MNRLDRRRELAVMALILAGGVGLWTKADSLTHFDDLVVPRLL
jgi:hypothetical protein